MNPSSEKPTRRSIEDIQNEALVKNSADYQRVGSSLSRTLDGYESRLRDFTSSHFLAIVGVLFIILAGLFFVKMSIDAGWLTPWRQILIATTLGLGLYLAPNFFPISEKKYGGYLAGAGVTVLHITNMGAYGVHELISAQMALVCATVIGLFTVFHNLQGAGSRTLLIVSIVGTYLTGPLVNSGDAVTPTIILFLAIWNIGFSIGAFFNKQRDVLFIAGYAATLSVLTLIPGEGFAQVYISLLATQTFNFLIFAGALTIYSINFSTPLSKEESTALFPLLLLFYGVTNLLLSILDSHLSGVFGLVLGLVIMAIYMYSQKKMKLVLSSETSLVSFAVLALIHSLYFQLAGTDLKPLLAMGMAALSISFWVKMPQIRERMKIPIALGIAPLVFSVIYTTLEWREGFNIFYTIIYGVLALIAATVVIPKYLPQVRNENYYPLIFGFAHFEILLGLFRFADGLTMSSSLFVTLSWGLYGIIILTTATKIKDLYLGRSALLILIAVSLKGLFYDVATAESWVRAVCLLAQGLFLYGAGWVFQKMATWKTADM